MGMKNLIRGVVDFHERLRPEYQKTFAKLALGQRPDALFIACSDSRVAPNVFASTDPGDVFVVRNVGNLVPPCSGNFHEDTTDAPFEANTVAAALEFSLTQLPVRDIIVCGHSECGAVAAILDGRKGLAAAPHLKQWLRHGEASLESLSRNPLPSGKTLSRLNQLSQSNVLLQLDHLLSYPEVARRVNEKSLRLHAWWFDIGNAEVEIFDVSEGRFVVLNKETATRLLGWSDKA